MGDFRSKRVVETEPPFKSLFSYLLNRSPESARKRSFSGRQNQVECKPKGTGEDRVSAEGPVRQAPKLTPSLIRQGRQSLQKAGPWVGGSAAAVRRGMRSSVAQPAARCLTRAGSQPPIARCRLGR